MDRPRAADALRGLGFLIRDVSRLNARNFERHAAGLGLTLAQCRALCYVQRFEGASQARLAEWSDTDPMTLGRVLLRMEVEGYIERRAHPNDGRAHCLHLTPKAAPVLARIWRLADRSLEEALSGLQASERDQLLLLLGRVRNNLEATTSESEHGASITRRSQHKAA
jgi:MarR family transcriptional regulator, transcriptional regulator for hemolysin